jgi:Xaa-Pro dipeptidase
VRPSVKPPVVDMSLHAENRARLVRRLREAGAPAGAVVLLQGGPSVTRHETDHEVLFRQESHFHWTFGVREPDFFGSVDVDTGRCVRGSRHIFPPVPTSERL